MCGYAVDIKGVMVRKCWCVRVCVSVYACMFVHGVATDVVHISSVCVLAGVLCVCGWFVGGGCCV